MSSATLSHRRGAKPWPSVELLQRLAPTLVAAAFAAAYVIISPPSLDLAAHLFRAQLFRMEGFGIWNNSGTRATTSSATACCSRPSRRG